MTNVSPSLHSLEAGDHLEHPRCLYICLTQVFFQQTLAQGERALMAGGCLETHRTGGTCTAGGLRVLRYHAGCGCTWHGVGCRRTTPPPWPHLHGGAGAALGEGAVSSPAAFEEPPSKGGEAPRRTAWRARACSCLPRARTRLLRRGPSKGGGPAPWAAGGKSAAQPAAMTAALTLPGSAERGTRWRVQTKPEPRVGGRAAGGALPGTCPRDDSGKRLPGEEERE